MQSPVPDKGKGRAPYTPDQLAPPSATVNGGTSSSPHLSGNIGSSTQSASRPANRQTVGGMQVETR